MSSSLTLHPGAFVGERAPAVFAILLISLIAAILSGMAVFARAGGGRGSVLLDIAFCVSVAVFLGMMVIIIVRKAATTFERAEDSENEESSGGQGRGPRK